MPIAAKLKRPKKEKPAPDASNVPEPKALTEVHYKQHVFPVRKNFIGVGQQLNQLINKYDENMFIEPLWLMRQPEYEKYSLCIHNCRQYMADINDHQKKLEAVAKSDKATIKQYQDIIAAGTRAIEAETAVLTGNPAVAAAGALYNSTVNRVRFAFVNDPENIRAAAEILLVGDLSLIDFETFDDALVSFRDELFSVFFSMKMKMQGS